MSISRRSRKWSPFTWYGVLRAILLVGIAGYLCWQIALGWGQIVTLDIKPGWSLVLGSLFSAVIAYQFLFGGWLILLARTGYFRFDHMKYYGRIWWVSYFFRYAPGKVMLLVERSRMGARIGINPLVGAGLALVETILAILTAGWLSLLAVATHLGSTQVVVITLVVMTVGIFVGLPVAFQQVIATSWVKRKYPDLSNVRIGYGDLLTIIPAYLGFYLCIGTSLFLAINLIQDLSWESWPGICGIYAFSHFIGLLVVISPGGLGAREGVLSVQIETFLAQGVAEAFVIGVRIWFTLIESLILFIVLRISAELPEESKP